MLNIVSASRGKGTGQGLAIAYNVVVIKHGGTLAFDTQLGNGSTFYVRLPRRGVQGREAPDERVHIHRIARLVIRLVRHLLRLGGHLEEERIAPDVPRG